MRAALRCLALLLVLGEAHAAVAPETVVAGRLGPVSVYAPADAPESLVVLIAGEGGWDREADDLARQLQGWGALVAGVDGPGYAEALRRPGGACSDLTPDLLELARTLGKHTPLPPRPILIGYGAGAALVY
ncbi:MAG: AcvB/VirJ family lysyl-phosphatidylglycerol hydrolase, partial [Gammaproteobacteria bacterium]